MELKIVNGKNINETEKTENDILDYFETILIYIINILTSGNFSIGAKTNQGFGKVKLEKEEYLKYDLSTMQVWDWLLKTDSKKNEIKTLQDKNKIIHLNIFKISFKAKIDSSLIIGDSHPQAIAQKFHLKSNNEPILSGSSLKGAVRARAEKILRTIGFNLDNEQNLFWINFFGHEGDSKIKEQARKSRLSVTESFFEKKPNEELQSRIKIDRFTGGTIEGALFDSVPLFQNKDNTACVTFEINIRDFNNDKQEDKAAAGLLLLVLKDLWTSDLPIGGEKNVGRGRLRGVGATISFPLLYIGDSSDAKSDVLIELKLDENGNPQTTEKNWEQLEGFVLALNNLVGKP
jgi:CRISPR/Cas system CSM-associated protein Csm3 (group 7 of RAMP superfamily)